jgi:hypothetical protein
MIKTFTRGLLVLFTLALTACSTATLVSTKDTPPSLAAQNEKWQNPLPGEYIKKPWMDRTPNSTSNGETSDAYFENRVGVLEAKAALQNAARYCPALAKELLEPGNENHLVKIWWQARVKSLLRYAPYESGFRLALVSKDLRDNPKLGIKDQPLIVYLPSSECLGVIRVTGFYHKKDS